jgi:hypothetical protein
MTVQGFEAVIFSGSTTASPILIGLSHDLMPRSPKVVFTHGDFHSGNIMVRAGDVEMWKVAALPEYCETCNGDELPDTRRSVEWYKYMPQSISLSQYPIQWLVDRVCGQNAANSY